MRFWFFSLALSAGLFFASSLANATTVLGIDRFVRTSTSVQVVTFFEDDRAGVERSNAAGLFDEAVVDGVGIGDLANAIGEATQESFIDHVGGTLTIEAGGGAGVIVDANNDLLPTFARATAESSLSITFEVDEASAYALSFSLIAELAELNVFSETAAANSDVFARAILLTDGGEAVFDTLAFDPTADDDATTGDLTLHGVLLPGVYRLDVSASAFLKASESASGLASSGYGLSLIVIPEPGTFLLAGLGLVGLAIYARRSAAPTAS